MSIKEKLVIPALILIAISTATAFMAKGGTGNKTTTTVEGYVIPFIGTPQYGMEQGYFDGYITAKLLSVNVTPGKLIKAKAQITYIGLASAPSRLPVEAKRDEGWIPTIGIKSIEPTLDKYGGTASRVLKSILSKGVARFDEHVKDRIWIYVSKVVVLDEPKKLMLERNKTITVTFVLKPVKMSPAERDIFCSMLKVRSRFGSLGSVAIDLDPLVQTEKPIASGSFDILGTKIYELICNKNKINIRK